MKHLCALVIVPSLLLGALPLAAHHSNVGRYQLDRIEEVEGTVTALSLRNPHSVLTVDAVDGEGATTRWNIEFVGITQLRRTGVKLDQLQVGDRVIVGGMAPATAAREIFGRYVVLSHDGRQTPLLGERSLESKMSGAPAGVIVNRQGDTTRPELGLFRVWTTVGFVALFPRGNLTDYPLTDTAADTFKGFDAARDKPTLYCQPKGMPLIMEQPYPFDFTDNGETLTLRLEEYDSVRTIHLTDSVESDPAASLMGYSRGQWQGETLVVTTTAMTSPWLTQDGIPLSADAVVTERFTPVNNGGDLQYEMLVNDPTTFIEPVRFTKTFFYLPELVVSPYQCADTAP